MVASVYTSGSSVGGSGRGFAPASAVLHASKRGPDRGRYPDSYMWARIALAAGADLGTLRERGRELARQMARKRAMRAEQCKAAEQRETAEQHKAGQAAEPCEAATCTPPVACDPGLSARPADASAGSDCGKVNRPGATVKRALFARAAVRGAGGRGESWRETRPRPNDGLSRGTLVPSTSANAAAVPGVSWRETRPRPNDGLSRGTLKARSHVSGPWPVIGHKPIIRR